MLSPEIQLASLIRIGVSIQNLNRRSEKQSGLSLVQWCALRELIDMPAASAHSLAKAVGISPSTLTQTLKRLEKKGFIFLSNDVKDSRKKLVTITRAGKHALENTSARLQSWSSDLADIQKTIGILTKGTP